MIVQPMFDLAGASHSISVSNRSKSNRINPLIPSIDTINLFAVSKVSLVTRLCALEIRK